MILNTLDNDNSTTDNRRYILPIAIGNTIVATIVSL